jgi:hypothetical protein
MAKNIEKTVVPNRSRKTKDATVAPMTARRAEPTTPTPATTLEQRVGMIAEAAYYRAEARGFTPGNEVEDWLVAEREIDARISNRR